MAVVGAALSIALTAITDGGGVGLQLFAVAGITISLLALLWPQLRGQRR